MNIYLKGACLTALLVTLSPPLTGCESCDEPTPPDETGTEPPTATQASATQTQPGTATAAPTATQAPTAGETETELPPTPTAEGPTPTAEGPTPTAAGPTPTVAGPTPTAAGPTPTVAGPTPTMIVVVTPTPAGPTPTVAGPTPTAAGPTPTVGGPTATPAQPTATAPGGDDTPTATQPEPTDTPVNLTLSVTVADSVSGAPVSQVALYDDGAFLGYTNAQGVFTKVMPNNNRRTLTGIKDGYHFVTLQGTPSMTVRLPIRKVVGTGYVGGDVDFSKLSSLTVSELRLGLVTRSIYENPVGLDFNTIIAGYRDVDLCGIQLTLPSNFVGALRACPAVTDYVVPGTAGAYSMFTFVGDLPKAQAIATLTTPNFYENLGKVFGDFQDSLDEFEYIVTPSVTLNANATTTLNPQPDGPTSASTNVVLGDLPDGITEDTPPLTIMIADMGATGYLAVGLAGGSGTVSVYHAPFTGALAGKPVMAMAMAGEGGVGSAGPFVAVQGRQESPGAAIVMPEFMPILRVIQSNATTRSFPYTSVEGADLYKVIFRFHDANDIEWDYYQLYSADDLQGDAPVNGAQILSRLPDIDQLPLIHNMDWLVSAYDTGGVPFELYASPDGPGLEDADMDTDRMARHLRYNIWR